MEWEILVKFLPEVDFSFHEDNPKSKVMTAQALFPYPPAFL